MKASNRATDLYMDSLVWDMTLPWIPGSESSLRARMLQRILPMYDAVSLTVGVDWDRMDAVVRHVANLRRTFAARDDCLLVDKASDIERARQEGRLGIVFHFQGTNPIESNLDMVSLYYSLGVRHMLLAYNQRNPVGDGCHEPSNVGLSAFGKALIKEMNRVGMMIDCSHTGERTTLEAMEASAKPVIFSHSVAKALWDHERNITDEQIRKCAATGGVIGVNGVGMFLADNEATTEHMARHIDHIARLVGPEHIGIGLDMSVDQEKLAARYREDPSRWPRGYPPPPWEIVQCDALPELVGKLMERGYSDADVRGILGENFLRVARSVWS